MQKKFPVQVFLGLLLTVLACSCEKMNLLKENPPSNYYLDQPDASELQTLVTGMYEPLARSRGRLWESAYGINLELMAEYSFSSDLSYQPLALYNFGIIQNVADTWTTFYQAIGRANFILYTLNAGSPIDAATVARAKGEAAFVRALCYYNLVRTWGSVPLRLQPVLDGNNTGQPLATIDQIYTQLAADLQLAIAGLPVTVPAANAGRATRGAAITLMADIALTRGDYAMARQLAKSVMDSSAIYGYRLEPSLALIFSPTVKTNGEDIFSIKFADIAAYGNFLPAYVHDPRALQAGLAARGLQRIATKKTVALIQGWDPNDQRRSFNLYDTITISGVRMVAALRTGEDYFYGKYKDPGAPAENGAGNSFYLLRYADVLLIFAEAENQLNGPTAAAYESVNEVRRRGYGLPVGTPSAVSDLPAGLGKAAFDDDVFRERGYEFFFEDKRWYDLKRTGRVTSYVTAAGKPVPAAAYWPIPDIEIANNPALH